LGIVAESVFGGGLVFALFTSLISVAVFWVLYSKKEDNHFAKIFLLAGIAFTIGILRMTAVDISPDSSLAASVGRAVSFEAVISQEPDVRDSTTRYTVNPDNFKGLILLVANRFPELQYGDKIKVSGKLDVPKNFSSDNGTEFDYVSYLSKDDIHFIIYHPNIEKIDSGNKNKIIYYLYSLKNIFIGKIERVVPEPNASLLSGVIFGAKQSLGENLLNDFRKAGLIHIVVLSGYNITIIAIGIFYLASFLGRRKLGCVISAASIVLFAVMVGLGATVLRACIMALIAILAKFLGRPADALRWLFIAGLLMLLWNPLILFYDPSFQLSFMATLGLILFSPFVLSLFSRYRFLNFIPEKFGLREIISATLAVQLFVLPLLIRMSGFVSIISFVVNPLVLPMIPWVMALGALTGALGIVSQILSWPVAALSYFFTQVIISITEFSASIPYATLQIGTLPLWVILLWYGFYGFVYLKLKKCVVV